MNSLLPAWMEELEDLKKLVGRCPHCGSLEPQHMARASTFIVTVIERCRQRRPQARTQVELDALRAEEEGLLDALFDRNHTHQYRDSPPGVFERYAISLHYGRAMIRWGCVDVHQTTSSNRTQA